MTNEENIMPENNELNPETQPSENIENTVPEQEVMTSEADKYKAQYDEVNDKYLRLVAEFDNFRKRNAKEKMELIKTASEDVIKSLLDVLDDSDRAIQQLDKSDNVAEIKEGITLVFNKLKNTLSAQGLVPMETKHQEFNADFHEAITEIPAPSEELVGKVIDEVTKGYTLNDKIIRHAKVVVGK